MCMCLDKIMLAELFEAWSTFKTIMKDIMRLSKKERKKKDGKRAMLQRIKFIIANINKKIKGNMEMFIHV